MPARPLAGTPNLGPRIRALRTARKLTAVELARKAGISRQTIAKIECGVSNDIKLGHAVALAGVLGVSLDMLCETTVPVEALLAAEEIVQAKAALQVHLQHA